MSRIDVRHVTHEYAAGDQDVSFIVGASESVCVLGQSGCGKTTLLNLLAGFFRPTRGKILVAGRAMAGKEGDRGIVFQDFARLFPWRTAQRNVELGLNSTGSREHAGARGPPQHRRASRSQARGPVRHRARRARSRARDPRPR